jgi:hypothetical protein
MDEQGLDWTGMGINSRDEYQKYIAERTVMD